jgi:hypothetical protein
MMIPKLNLTPSICIAQNAARNVGNSLNKRLLSKESWVIHHPQSIQAQEGAPLVGTYG